MSILNSIIKLINKNKLNRRENNLEIISGSILVYATFFNTHKLLEMFNSISHYFHFSLEWHILLLLELNNFQGL